MQNAFEAILERLRVSGALRYNIAIYKTQASDAPIVNDQPLFPNDSAKFEDFSGRIGAVMTVTNESNAAFNYSRGFRVPNITSLGRLELVGVGFQVSTNSVIGLGATVGTTVDASAVSSDIEVVPLRSEISTIMRRACVTATNNLKRVLQDF